MTKKELRIKWTEVLDGLLILEDEDGMSMTIVRRHPGTVAAKAAAMICLS